MSTPITQFFIHMHTHRYTHMRACIIYEHARSTLIYIQIHTYTQALCSYAPMYNTCCTFLLPCIQPTTHTHLSTHTHTYPRTHPPTRTMHACTHTHAYTTHAYTTHAYTTHYTTLHTLYTHTTLRAHTHTHTHTHTHKHASTDKYTATLDPKKKPSTGWCLS